MEISNKERSTVLMCIGISIMVQLVFGTMTDRQYIEVKNLYKKIEEETEEEKD